MFDNHNSCFCKYVPKAGILFLLQNKQEGKKPPTNHSISLNYCSFESRMLFHLICFFLIVSQLFMTECYLKDKFLV